MNSKYVGTNQATSQDNLYGAHYAELLSDKVTYDANIGKFCISYLNPSVSTDKASDSTKPRSANGNTLNKDNLGMSSVTRSNYIELEIPKHLFTLKEVKITTSVSRDEGHMVSCTPTAQLVYNEFLKGQKFIIVNISGNINIPKIIGVV